MTGLRSIDPLIPVRQQTAAGPLGRCTERHLRRTGPAYPRERRALRGGLLSTTALVGAAALVWASPAALAGPTGGTVVAGNATIATAGATTQITTNSQRTIINWTGVSLKPGETMSFVQPSVSAATLNRVTGNEPSLLQGTLSSNGQVYLINPNGIVVGQGIVTPSFSNVTGLGTANPTFNITQGILSAATPKNGLVTVQLFGTLPNRSLTATHGEAVNLNRGGNQIGGTFTVSTGPALGSISLASGDVNLGQSGAISTGSNLEILAHKGTVFGGTSALNNGLGAFVGLANVSNVFGNGNAVFLSDVSNTTLDGSSGVTIGGSLGGSLFTNTIHGNLTVATGGAIDIASPILAHSSGSPDTAVVSLVSTNGAVTEDTTNGAISAATLAGSAGTSASLSTGISIGTLAGFATHNGDFLFDDTTGVAITGTVSATGGNASIVAAGNILLSAPVIAATGAVTLDATAGAITDPGNTGGRTDAAGASVTLLASAGIGVATGSGTAGTPLVLAAPMIAAVTDKGGIDLVNNTAVAAAVSTLGVTSGPGDILFLQRGGGSLSIGNATDPNGSIAIEVQRADLTLTNASTGHGGNITLGAGGLRNLTLNGTVTASGNLLGRAETNVHLDAAMLASGGRTTLVVDDAFPSRGIGPGALSVTGATTIDTQTGDNLALFLARRSQVTIAPSASLTLNGQPFFDEPNARLTKDLTVAFVHFGIYFSPTIAPDAAVPFSVFFKETLQIPPPTNFEDETPLPRPNDQSYPIAFAMLYQSGNAPATVASLAAINPAAGGAGAAGTAGTDGVLGYARISSYDVAPDVLSAINRPLYMDLENPKTEEQLGYELRPTLQARVEGMSAEALAGIEPGGPGAFSCARLPETLALLGDNPELAQHLRDLCAGQGGRNLPEVPARPVRYFRPAR